MNFETILPINTNKSYLIHFRFKSTEEFINKYRRGYSNWHGNQTLNVLFSKLVTYFRQNRITLDKINYIEKELKLNLSVYRTKLKLNKTNYNLKNFLILN